MTHNEPAVTLRAYDISPGMIVLGPRDWHVKIESNRRTAKACYFVGVNGFGEEVKFRRAPGAEVVWLKGHKF